MTKRKYRNDYPQPDIAAIPRWLRLGPPVGKVWRFNIPRTPERVEADTQAWLRQRLFGRPRGHLSRWEKVVERHRRLDTKRQEYVREYCARKRAEQSERHRKLTPLRTHLLSASRAEQALRKRLRRTLRKARAAERRWRAFARETTLSEHEWRNLRGLHWRLKRNLLSKI